jgi:hypothetical protein
MRYLPLLLLLGCSPSAKPEVKRAPLGTPAMHPGFVDHPEVVAAEKSTLTDDAEVFGVVVGDKARAYSVKALRPFTSHIVNDRVGGRAVSVTYCDKKDCVKGFTRDGQGPELELSVGGYIEGMLVMYKGKMYRQDDGTATMDGEPKLTLPEYPVERATWKAWRTKHPGTDVFGGVAKI